GIDIEKQAKKMVADAIKDNLIDKVDGKGSLLDAANGLIGSLKAFGILTDSSENTTSNTSNIQKKESQSNTPNITEKSTSAPNSRNSESIQESKPGIKTYTAVRSTHFVKTMAENYLKETVTIDEKGDVTAFLTQANKKPIRWSKKYSIFPDCVTIESKSLQYPKNFNSETFANTLRENKDFTDVFEIRRYNDNTIRLYAEIKTDDSTEFYNELLKVTMLMHGVHQLLSEAIDQEDNLMVRFSTELVSKLLSQNNMKYTVDKDGDIRVDHVTASGKNISWFTWYLISPTILTLDSGCSDIPKDFDIDNLDEQLKLFGGSISKMVKVTKSSNGSLRLRCTIEATSPENVVQEWDSKHVLLENLWAGIHDLIQYSKKQEEKRLREAEEKARRLAAEEEEHLQEQRERAEHERQLNTGFYYTLRPGGTVRSLQEGFTEDYPYLRLGVYMVKTGQQADRDGGAITHYSSDTQFGDIRSFKGECKVRIEGRSTPESLEKEFRRISGLVIKICYNDENDHRYYISKDSSWHKMNIYDLNKKLRELGYYKADIS
ncbi:MAG: hypothetical protein K2N10_02275, partial [Muribaculaceae bacterium]|nr:hypothetical protein [Muribaculaceae bacterium]